MQLIGRPLAFLQDLWGFTRFVLRRWSEDSCLQVAASLTYTTLLAIVPSFAVAVALLSWTPFFGAVMSQVKAFLRANLAPQIADRIIGDYMTQFATNAQQLTWVGTVAVLVLSVATLLMIDHSLNGIWRARRQRSYWVLVPCYLALLVLFPLFLGLGMAATTYVESLAIAGVPGLAEQAVLVRLGAIGLTALAFFTVYTTVPQRRVPWPHALVGSLVAAVLFEAAKILFAVYVLHASTYSVVYGAVAAVPLFFIWIELSWIIVLLGAEITAASGYWHARLWTRANRPGTHFHEAVRVARALVVAAPGAIDFDRLRKEAVLPAHELEDLLVRLCEAGIVRPLGRRQYALASSPDEMTVAQLYEAAVAPLGGMKPEEWAEISADFAHAAERMREGLERPLASLSGKLP